MTVNQTDAERTEGICTIAAIFLAVGETPESLRKGEASPIVAEVADAAEFLLAEGVTAADCRKWLGFPDGAR